MNDIDDEEKMPKMSRAANIGLGTTLVASLGLCAVTVPFLRRFSGAPYVASSQSARNAISRHIKQIRRAREGNLNLIDLGSGSGEIVLHAATSGFRAHGVELNPWLVALSRWRAWRGGIHDATFSQRCLWSTPLHEQDVVVVFGIPDIMSQLSTKLEHECKPDGAWIVSNTFRLPNRQPVRTESGVHFYFISTAAGEGSYRDKVTV